MSPGMAAWAQMPSLHERPENEGVLRYLSPGEGVRTVARPPADLDTWRLGAHPDTVERLWTHLNAAMGADCRFLVADTVALVAPDSGLILALALGTQYALRLTGEGLLAALEAGYDAQHEFRTVGRTLDLSQAFGPGWVFGRHDQREGAWLAETAASANL